MMESVWWIREIDWRISSGVIFFIQLVVWKSKEERKHYPLRILVSFLALCCSSWCMRYVLETWMYSRLAVAGGYSVYIMLLSLLFALCYHFCYRDSRDAVIYNGIIAMTVYRMCWDAVKLISAIPVGNDAAWTGGSPIQSVMSYILYLGLSIFCCKLYRYIVKRPVSFSVKAISGLFAALLLCQMLLEFTYQLMNNDSVESSMLFFLTAFLYCVVNFILLVMAAYLVLLQEENIGMQNFIRNKQQYYEISREGILSLQIKCHDLKHQIARIRSAEGQRQMDRYMDRLVDCLDEYNTVIDSGNKSLDVVLTEKNIICSMNGVRFTYIVDGTLFSFLTDMEIYALFGNVMDNAFEGMADVVCAEKKFISLKAAKRDNMVILVVENYFEHELKFQDGIPVTTKVNQNHHGFGLRSIMSIAREHGGDASVQAENNIFKLTVSMQNRQKKEGEE